MGDVKVYNKGYVSENFDSQEKEAVIHIIERRIYELRDELEDLGLSDAATAAARGGILQLRDLIDLFSP